MEKGIQPDPRHLEDTLAYIRQQRSNESNFKALYDRLEQEGREEANGEEICRELQEIKEKNGEAYLQARATSGQAWPEFENFVSSFEKALTEALRKATP